MLCEAADDFEYGRSFRREICREINFGPFILHMDVCHLEVTVFTEPSHKWKLLSLSTS